MKAIILFIKWNYHSQRAINFGIRSNFAAERMDFELFKYYSTRRAYHLSRKIILWAELEELKKQNNQIH